MPPSAQTDDDAYVALPIVLPTTQIRQTGADSAHTDEGFGFPTIQRALSHEVSKKSMGMELSVSVSNLPERCSSPSGDWKSDNFGAAQDDSAAIGTEKGDPPAMSLLQATLMLCAPSFGTGVFVMPSVFATIGIGPGMAMMIGFGVFATLVIHVMANVAEHGSARDFSGLLQRVPGGPLIQNLSIVTTVVMSNAAHMSFVSSMLFDLMEVFVSGDYGQKEFSYTRKLVVMVLLLGWVMPYCFERDLSMLRHVGATVSVSIVLVCTAVVIDCLVNIAQGHAAGLHTTTTTSAALLPDGPASVGGFLALAPNFPFCFSSFFLLFPVRQQLKRSHGDDAGQAKFKRANVLAGALQIGVYSVVALVGAIRFGTGSFACSPTMSGQ